MSARSRYLAAINAAPPPPSHPSDGHPSLARPAGPVPAGIGSIDDDNAGATNEQVEVVAKIERSVAAPQHHPVPKSVAEVAASTPSASLHSEKDFSPQLANQKRQWDAQRDIKVGQVSAMAASMFGRGPAPTPPPLPGSKAGSRRGTPSLPDNARDGSGNQARPDPSPPVDEGDAEGQGSAKRRNTRVTPVAGKFEAAKKRETEQPRQQLAQSSSLTVSAVDEGRTEVQARPGTDEEARDTSIPRTNAASRPSSASARLFVSTAPENEGFLPEEIGNVTMERGDPVTKRGSTQHNPQTEKSQARPSSEPVFEENAPHDENDGFGSLFPPTPFEGPTSPSFDETFGNMENDDEADDRGKSPTAAELKALVAERRRAALAMYESKELVKHDPVESFMPSVDSFPTAREMNKQAGVISPPSSSSPFVHDDGFGDFGDPTVGFSDTNAFEPDDDQGFPGVAESGSSDPWSRPPAPRTSSVPNFRSIADQMPSSVDPSVRGANVRVDSPAARRRYMAMQKSQADAMFKPIETSSASWDAFFPSDAGASQDTVEQVKAKSTANLKAATHSTPSQSRQTPNTSSRPVSVETGTVTSGQNSHSDAYRSEFDVAAPARTTVTSGSEPARVNAIDSLTASEPDVKTSVPTNAFSDEFPRAGPEQTAAAENDFQESPELQQEDEAEEDEEELMVAVPVDKSQRNKADKKDSKSKSRSFFGLFRRGDNKQKSKKGGKLKETKQKESKSNQKGSTGSFRRPQSRSSTPTEAVAAKSKATARSEAVKETQQPKVKTIEPKIPPQPPRPVATASSTQSMNLGDSVKAAAGHGIEAVASRKEGDVSSRKDSKPERSGSAAPTQRSSTADHKASQSEVRGTANVDSQRTITKPVKTSDLSSEIGDADDGPAVLGSGSVTTIKAGDLGKTAGHKTSRIKGEAADSVAGAAPSKDKKVTPPLDQLVARTGNDKPVGSKSAKSIAEEQPSNKHLPKTVDVSQATDSVPAARVQALLEKPVLGSPARSLGVEKKTTAPEVPSLGASKAVVSAKSAEVSQPPESSKASKSASSGSTVLLPGKEARSGPSGKVQSKLADNTASRSSVSEPIAAAEKTKQLVRLRQMEPETSKDPKPLRSSEVLPPKAVFSGPKVPSGAGRALQGLSKVVTPPPDPPISNVDSIETSDDEVQPHQSDPNAANDQELLDSAKENKPVVDLNGGKRTENRTLPVATKFSKPIVAKISAMPKETDAPKETEKEPEQEKEDRALGATEDTPPVTSGTPMVATESTPPVTLGTPMGTKESTPPVTSGKSMATARAKYRWQIREQKIRGENNLSALEKDTTATASRKEEGTIPQPEPQGAKETNGELSTNSFRTASKPEVTPEKPANPPSKSEVDAPRRKPDDVATAANKVAHSESDGSSALSRKLAKATQQLSTSAKGKQGTMSADLDATQTEQDQVIDGDGDGSSTISSETTETSQRKQGSQGKPGTASAVAAMQLVRKTRSDRNKGVATDRRSKGVVGVEKSVRVKESVSVQEQLTSSESIADSDEKRNMVSFGRSGDVEKPSTTVVETTAKESAQGYDLSTGSSQPQVKVSESVEATETEKLSGSSVTGISMSKRIMASRKSSSVSRQIRQSSDELTESDSTNPPNTNFLQVRSLAVPNLEDANETQPLPVKNATTEVRGNEKDHTSDPPKTAENAAYQPSVPASSYLSRMGKRGWPSRKLSTSEETTKDSDEKGVANKLVAGTSVDDSGAKARSEMDAPLSPVGLNRVASGDEFDLTKVDSDEPTRSSKPKSSYFARARARARSGEVTTAKTSSKAPLLPPREVQDVPPAKREAKRANNPDASVETIHAEPAFKKHGPPSSSLSTRMASAALSPLVNVKPAQTSQRPATPDIAAPRSPRVVPAASKSQRFVPSMLPRGQSPAPHVSRAPTPISPRFHATASAVRLSPRVSSPLTISTSPTPEQYIPNERYAFQSSPRLRAAQEKKNKSVVMIDRMEKVETAAVKIQSLVHIKRAREDLKQKKGTGSSHAALGSTSRAMSQRFGGPENVGKPLNRRPASIIKKSQPARVSGSPVALVRKLSWDGQQKSRSQDPYSALTNDPIQRAGIRLLSAAAIPIQTEIRRYQAKQTAWRRFCALILLQAYMRRWLWEIRLERFIASAVKVQAAFRGWLARDNLEDEHYCATQIQRIVRGYFATMNVYRDLYSVTIVQSVARMRLAKMEADVRLASVILLQSCYRGYACRRDLEKEQFNATAIQSAWRRYSAQTNYQFDIVDIIIVQSVYRRRAAMRVLSDKRFVRDSRSATLIQTQWRAYDSTMNYLHTMADILIVQSVVRRWKAMKAYPGFRFRRYYECASQIQRVVRGKLARDYVNKGMAARNIQKVFRGYVAFNCYVEYRAAERIQKIWRGYLAFRNYVEWIAATQIQKTWRGYVFYQNYKEYVAAREIQKVWRGYVASQNYLEYRSARDVQKIWRGHRAYQNFVEYRSARAIQRIWRGHCAYQDYLEYRSAQTIQRVWRGHCAYQDYVEYRSAQTIQRIWRGHCAYQDYVEYRSAREIQKSWRRHRDLRDYTQFVAARTLQNRWRCRVACQSFTSNKAARNIQSIWRGYMALQKYVEFLAARDIQKVWRGYVALQAYVEYVAARDIQRVWRGFVAIQEFVEHIAARDIQTAWRGYVIYRSYMEHLAACEIQRVWRGHIVYLEYTVYIAARDVQRIWRGYFAHKAYTHFASARKIQKIWRGNVAHTAYIEYTAARRLQRIMRGHAARKSYAEYTAARNIQRIWRGHVAYGAYTEYTAARYVQKIWRGHVANKAYTHYTAARNIQKTWRGHVAHKAHTEYIAARNLQRTWRGHVSHQAFVRHKAARDVQKVWRGYVAFKEYMRYIAASEIQRTWRGFTAYRDYKKYKAATAIQKIWRGFTAYQKFIENMAATYIQKSWRRYSARKKYIQYRSATHIQRMWRGFQCYTDYIFVIADVIIAQRTARQWLAKRTRQRLIVDREEKTRNEAATTVQKYWRGYQAHMSLLFTLVHIIIAQSVARRFIALKDFRPRMAEHRAARTIQTSWRRHSKRSAFVEYVCARNIQATWRCFVTRQAYVDYLSSRVIQTRWRRYSARKKFVEYIAARRLQLAWRSHAARVKLERHRKARDIQTRWRSYTARDAFVQYLKARAIQTHWRSFSARRTVIQNKSARLLQAHWRGYVTMQNYIDYILARRIQMAWRIHAAKSALTKHQKARSVQAMWRMQVSRAAYVEYVSARKLQATWRMKSRRLAFTKYVGARDIQALWRMHSSRRAYVEYVAARKMQAAWRMRASRNAFLANRGAQKMQALWRMYVSREAYIQYVSARKVQSVWRGVSHRIRRERAAVMIQKTWRGFMQYSNYVISRFEEHAATTIQRYWRGFLACTQYIIVHFEIVRIQALVRGHQERTWLKHQEKCAVVIQTEARRYLAKEEFRERKLISILVNSRSAAVRAKGCAKRLQRWWRGTLRQKKEKKSALIIERFFIFVKEEVDKEIQRREKHKQAKREKRQRQKKEADEKLLERVWLNTVESDEQENGGLVQPEMTSEKKPRSGSRSRPRLSSDDNSKHPDDEYRSTRRSSQRHDGERARRDPLLSLDSDDILGKHAQSSSNFVSRPSSRTRNSPLPQNRRNLHADTVIPVGGSHYLPPTKGEEVRARRRVGHDSIPPARTVDLQEDSADVASEVSGLTAPSVFARPNAPTPSRLGTLSWKELSDDLSLEEAWIDSEIHQVKQKRRSEDQYLQRHGLTASSLSPRRSAPTSEPPKQVRRPASRGRSRIDQPPLPSSSSRRSSSRSRIQDSAAAASRRSSRRSVSAQPTRSSSAPRQHLDLDYTPRVGRSSNLSVTTDNLEVKERRLEKNYRSSADRRIEPLSTPEASRQTEAPSTFDTASVTSSGERVSRLQRPSAGSQRRRSQSPQVDTNGVSVGPSLQSPTTVERRTIGKGPSLESPTAERRTPSKGIPLPTDYGTSPARSSRRAAMGETSGGRRSAIPAPEPSPSVRRALDFAKRKSQLAVSGSPSTTPRRSLLVEPSPTAARRTPVSSTTTSAKSRNPSEGASRSGLQRPRS